MKWYQYSPETGEYVQPVICQVNPKGGHLIPPNATPDAPPVTGDNQIALFESGGWQLKEDHRGKVVYNKADKTELEIKELGPIPETHTELKPNSFDQWVGHAWQLDTQAEQEHLSAVERQWAMAELALTDRALTPDFPITDEGRTQLLHYRAQLRNPARSQHPNFPEPQWRPQWPEGVKRPAG